MFSYTRKKKDETLDSHSVLILFSYTRNKKKNPSPKKVRLTLVTNSWQLPIKAGWIDAPLALQDLSQNNKYNIS